MDGIVGTGLDAGLAANADAIVEFDNTIAPLIHRLRGTDANTRRIGAMITPSDLEMTTCIGIQTGFHILDPGSIDA
jgi:hypothetical protein